MMDVDLRGVLLGTKHGIRAMVASGNGGVDRQLVVDRRAQRFAFTGVYSAAKAGVISLTKAAAIEYGAQGHPGQLHLPRLHPHRDERQAERTCPGMLEKAALNRGGQPEEVAEVAAFLASDRASFVSRRRHPGRRRVGREARLSPPGTVSTGEARAVRIPRAWHPSRRRCSSSPSSATRRRCWRVDRASSRCWRCGSPSSSTSSTSGASRSCGASSGATASSGSAPGPPRRAVEASAEVASHGAVARQGDAVHRPLPDPQPGHARRIDRPRRSRRRVPGGRARARRDAWRSPRRAAAAPSRRATSSTGCGARTWQPDELLVGVSFPIWGGRSGFAVEEFARRHGDFAIAGATVGIELDDDDRIARCAIGLIGLGSTPERADAAEAELAGRPITGRRARRGRSAGDGGPRRRFPPTSTARRRTARGSARRWWRAPGRLRARRRSDG